VQIITVASGKGGSCKSTTAALLAIRAAQDLRPDGTPLNVAIIDANRNQPTLAAWYERRERQGLTGEGPYMDLQKLLLSAAIAGFRSKGWADLVIIDTSPSNMRLIRMVVEVAHCVVIPICTSASDLDAIDAVIELCQTLSEPRRILLGAVDEASPRLVIMMIRALTERADVFGQRISSRPSHAIAPATGRVAVEIGDRVPAALVDAQWPEVLGLTERAGGEAVVPAKQGRHLHVASSR
jgi:cellulose biosynthesis protein BcsQ